MEANGEKASSGIPTFVGAWTDKDGVVHERQHGNTLLTRCGVETTAQGLAAPMTGCRACTHEGLRQYALNHDCRVQGCTEHLRGHR